MYCLTQPQHYNNESIGHLDRPTDTIGTQVGILYIHYYTYKTLNCFIVINLLHLTADYKQLNIWTTQIV